MPRRPRRTKASATRPVEGQLRAALEGVGGGVVSVAVPRPAGRFSDSEQAVASRPRVANARCQARLSASEPGHELAKAIWTCLRSPGSASP